MAQPPQGQTINRWKIWLGGAIAAQNVADGVVFSIGPQRVYYYIPANG
ncbi:hypothetical protein [Collimonas sp.]|nr:hypothetical protein [Collimonas sp.]HWX02262.1 hypothetical protein [Collimonas sp.]